uniref:Uncharacterized protein n=1 Tax=viral metagenome TaxID=1070528 RepID=A0A6C0JMC0_9ZZZZ
MATKQRKGTKRRGTMKRGGSKGKSKATFNASGKPEHFAKYATWGLNAKTPKQSHKGRPSKGKLNSAQKAMTPKK